MSLRHRVPIALAPVAAVLTLACASRGQTAAPPAPAAAASPAAAARPPLGLSLDDPELKIVADRARGGGKEEAVVYPDGTVFRDGRIQMQADAGLLKRILEVLDKANVSAMPESYPTGNLWAPHHLMVRTSQGVKEVHQVYLGEESAPLELAVRRILVLTQPREDAVRALDVADGLRKVASGALAPQALSVRIVRQSEGAASSAKGWAMRLEDGRLTRYRIVGGAHEKEFERRLGPEEVRQLAAAIAGHGLDLLPANVWAEEYTHLGVMVMGLEKDVLGRPSLGGAPESQGETPQRFQRLIDMLAAQAAPAAGAAAP